MLEETEISMNAATQKYLTDVVQRQRKTLAERWYALLVTTGFSPLSKAEVCQCLEALLEQMVDLLGTEPFAPEQARPIGAALIKLHYTQSEALEQTLLLLGQQLCTNLPAGDDSCLFARIPALLASISAGFTQRLLHVVLTEQEASRQAVLEARQQTELALRTSNARLETVVSNAPLVLLTIDRVGRITLAAGRGLLQVGLQRDSLIGQSFLEFFAEYPIGLEQYRRALTGESFTGISTFGGRIYEAHFTALTDANGTVSEVILVAIDVTEREQARTALEAERASLAQRVVERTTELRKVNMELVRVNQLKDNFVASMSHELRTPLHAILMLTEALRSGVYDTLPDQQHARLQQIETSGRHLLALINDILDLAKIGAGKMNLDQHLTDVVQVCQTSLKLIDQEAQSKSLRIIARYDAQVTTTLADSRRLTQILVNLLNNAVKFTPPNGTIGLTVVGDEDQQTISFTVWDTGIGIAEEDLSRLFQPFVQIDNSLARAYDGTGLGLVLVYHLTELHGGSVAVSSTPNEGSRFTVILPWQLAVDLPEGTELDVETEPMPPPSRCMPGNGYQPVIVLAEDHAVTMNLLSDYLQLRGYRVIEVCNGIEAIECIQENYPDVIVMDIQMPGLNGFDVIQYIRADATLSHIPIIAVTALAMPGDKERCLAVGANEYLSKPISLQQLTMTIEYLCQHE